MSHYGATPSAIADAILVELGPLKLQAGPPPTGCLKTLKRFAGDRYDLAAVDLQLGAGLPAMLVACLGGQFEPASTCGQLFYQRLRFSVLCAAGSLASSEERLASESPATTPGIEDLLDVATYHACRAAAGVAGVSRVKPLEHKWLRVEAGKYLCAVELELTRQVDLYDEPPAELLERIGLVHNPTDPEDLFEDDNQTPKQEEPLVGGGVAELE